MYFLGVPRGDWPPTVDARSPAQPEGSSIDVSSESGSMDVGRTECPPPVSEKIRGRGQRKTSRPRRRGKQGLLLPANLVAYRLAMIRPIDHEGPRCSIGLTTTKFKRLLRRARRSLREACARGINQGKTKKAVNRRRVESLSSGWRKQLRSRRLKSLRGEQQQSPSNQRRWTRGHKQNRG